MIGFPRRSIKPALWLVFILLLTLALAVPAQAEDTGVQVEADNPTVYVKSDYNLNFSTGSDISVGDAVYVNVFSDFDLSQTNLNDVQLKVGDEDYTGTVTKISAAEFAVSVTEQVYAGEEVSLFIPEVLNPSWPGYYAFASVSHSSYPGSVEIYNPDLVITPDLSTIEVNLRDKLSLELKDHNGGEFIAPYDVTGNLYTSYDGWFYPGPADVPGQQGYMYFTIPAGESGTEVYYQSDQVGTHNIYTQNVFLQGASLDDTNLDIDVTPAGQVVAEIYNMNYGDFKAGQPGKIELEIIDQYWNLVPQKQDLTVDLKDLTEYGEPAGGKFLLADENGEVTQTETTSVIIPKGESSVVFYYVNTKGSPDGYEVEITASGGNLDPCSDSAYIYSAEASKIVVTPEGDIAKFSGKAFIFNVQLQDEFGNLANPQQYPLTVNLKSTSKTGRFYDDYYGYGYWYQHDRVTQLTFQEDWWEEDGGNSKSFWYVDTTPGPQTITVEANNYLETGSVDIKVLPVPAAVVITPEEINWLVNQRGKVTIALKNADGSAYNVPGELSEGLHVVVETSSDDGSFFDALVGGNRLYPQSKYIDDQYYWGIFVNIPAGKDSIDLYYAPGEAGTNELFAELVECEETTPGQAIVTAMPAGGVYAKLEGSEGEDGELFFTAGIAGKVTVTVLDQEGNPVTQSDDLPVKLFTKTSEGEPSRTGAFYAGLNPDGTPAGDPVQEVTIEKDSVSAVVYYYDTRATGYDYELYLGTKITPAYGSAFQAVVVPASSNKLSVKLIGHDYYEENNHDPGNELFIANSDDYWWRVKGPEDLQDRLPAGRIFPMEISILDANGNPVPQSSELTVNLSVEGDAAGNFYKSIYGYDGSYEVNPVTQIKFQPGQKTKYIYFAATGSGSAVIKASVPGLVEANLPVTVQEPDRLAVHFPLVWEWDEEMQDEVEVEDNNVVPEERRRFVVMLTDADGHPFACTNQDITVNLTADDGVLFYASAYDGNAITSITIPAGFHGVQVFVEGPENEGTVNISAAATAPGISGTGDVEVEVALEGYFSSCLVRGWNTLSTPVALERAALNEIVKDAGNIVIAYTYDEVSGKWLQVYQKDNKWYLEGDDSKEFALKPQEALFVKMKGDSKVNYYACRTLTAPPTRSLAAGWNLISPAITEYDMKANEVLSSIDGKYSQVVSPGVGWQESWSYVPGSKYPPDMEAGKGYWIYMKEAGTLAGFSSTPVKDWYTGGGFSQ